MASSQWHTHHATAAGDPEMKRPSSCTSEKGQGSHAHQLHSHSSAENTRPSSSASQFGGAGVGSGTSTEYFESVVSMLSILSSADQTNAHRALLAITNSPESCLALRKAGCIPLLIQILHPVNLPPNEHPSLETKARASRALKNIVHFNPDEKQKRKEMRVLKLLEAIRTFSEKVRLHADCPHPVQSTTTLMKLSFDEEHRLTMCHLGAIHALADLIQADHSVHAELTLSQDCAITRRYSGMILTNLTFGDGTNKALLCSMSKFLHALVAQLDCQNEDVCQVTASVLRNLSWHADSNSRLALRDSNVVTKLTSAAIRASKESTLKATLSALWNLSAHSAANKSAICFTESAIDFLVGLLNYQNQSNGSSASLTIVENAGGILRNVATILPTPDGGAVREAFRACGLIEILLEHLKSSSLTVVSNACGTLWHISGNCPQDQQRLLDLGAMPKLKALMYSKHERISQGAGAAFKNLLAYSTKATPPIPEQQPMDLRRHVADSNAHAHAPPTSLQLQEQTHTRHGKLLPQEEPLDLSMHSSKSSPIHVVSASEFGSGGTAGARSTTPNAHTPAPPFLNPPIHLHQGCAHPASKYYSPKNYNSCPELMRFIQPAHQGPTSKVIDCSKSETMILEDTTINFSLHFTESEIEPPETEDSSPITKIEEPDTLKTYYCEGTPLNFSTSNSMTDLTQLDSRGPNKLQPIAESEAAAAAAAAAGGEDQPKKYCTEHTPANFSRASSLSSIASSNIQGGENRADPFVEENQQQQAPKLPGAPPLPPPPPQPKEKVKRNVTFSANETPLMFSRSSSVNSLESVEVNYEDGGSVMSEFSRRTSEVVSPSDLPDSPRQLGEQEQAARFQEKMKTELESEEAKTATEKRQEREEAADEEGQLKVFATGESAPVTGHTSVRSLSPLTIDGESVGIGLLKESSTSPPEMKPSGIPNLPPTSSKPILKHGGRGDLDELRIFAIEGTPFGVSNATSLSDIVCEFDKEPEPVAAASNQAASENPVTTQREIGPQPQPNSLSPSEESAAERRECEPSVPAANECEASDSKTAEPKQPIGPNMTEGPSAAAVVVTNNTEEEEPIYSDAQILMKCISAGKASRIPKSKSEFSKLNDRAAANPKAVAVNDREHKENVGNTGVVRMPGTTMTATAATSVKTSTSYHGDLKSKSAMTEIDEDLAALILKGKNKARSSASAKVTHLRSKWQKNMANGQAAASQSQSSISEESSSAAVAAAAAPSAKEKEPLYASQPPQAQEIDKKSEETITASGEIPLNQQSVSSIASFASEWNDETPTISSTIPSMSISTAFRLVEEKNKNKDKPQALDQEVQAPATATAAPFAALIESTLTSVQPPSSLSAISSSECKRKTYTKTDGSGGLLQNQKPPPELDMENSMMSVASLKSEIASTAVGVDGIEVGMGELSIGGPGGADAETYTIGGSCGYNENDCDGTDIDDSLREDSVGEGGVAGRRLGGSVSSIEQNGSPAPGRFLTFTRSHSNASPKSPRQRRQEDPARYLTRTITPVGMAIGVDANGNNSSPTTPTGGSVCQFATFKVDRSSRGRPLAATSNESSPSSSPRVSGIRGRRKQLYYASLPLQKRAGPVATTTTAATGAPPIPPKPTSTTGSTRPALSLPGGGPYVRPTRSSELRAALAQSSSREPSPRRVNGSSKQSSRNSSNTSLNNAHVPPQLQQPTAMTAMGPPAAAAAAPPPKKIPPKPPARTVSTSTPAKSFAVVRAVRNSNSSIGFINEPYGRGADGGSSSTTYSTLPRSGRSSSGVNNDNGNGPHHKEKESKVGKLSNFWNQLTKGSGSSNATGKNGNGDIEAGLEHGEKKTTTRFGIGFSFGKKKKDIHSGSNPAGVTTGSSGGLTGGVWVKRDAEGREGKGSRDQLQQHKIEREKAFVLPFNYNRQPALNPNALMTNSTSTKKSNGGGDGSSGGGGITSKMTTV